MPDSTVHPTYSFHDYEELVVEHYKKWMNTFLAIRERDVGITPGAIARPRSWFTRQEFTALPGYESTPAIIVVSTGSPEPPRMTGNWVYDVDMRFAIVALTHAPEAEPARELAGHYQAALLQLALRQKKINPKMRLNQWLGFGLDDLDVDQERTLASVRMEFAYLVKDFVTATGGPLTVPDDELAPIPDPGTVQSVNINIEEE